eukprot:778335-Prymnesium_polylepis.1
MAMARQQRRVRRAGARVDPRARDDGCGLGGGRVEVDLLQVRPTCETPHGERARGGQRWGGAKCGCGLHVRVRVVGAPPHWR